MRSIQELGINMGKFAKKNASALIISTVLSVGTAADGYEMVVREGKDIAPIAESIDVFIQSHITIPDCPAENPDGTPHQRSAPQCDRIMPSIIRTW